MGIVTMVAVLYVFVFGLIIGSFLNVVIYRLPQKLSVAKGRSFCPNCQTLIKGRHNIPVLSFLCLKGSCAYCHEKISWRYPIIELLTGVLAVFILSVYGFSLQSLVVFSIGGILICMTMIDHDTMTIPNGLVIGLMIPGILSVFVFPEVPLISRIIGIFAVSLPMILLSLLIADAFGGGDIKLMAVAGFILGWESTLVAMFIGILGAGLYGCFLLLRKDRKRHMAFGPYLCLGIMIALIYGQEIIEGYLRFFSLI